MTDERAVVPHEVAHLRAPLFRAEPLEPRSLRSSLS